MDDKPQNFLLDVIKSPQSYRNIGYLFASFPLGLLYFIILVVGSSLGMGLAVIGVGIFILWGLFGAGGYIANFERWMSNSLLKTNLPMRNADHFNFRSGDNWRNIGYLALKFPLGLMTFIFTVFMVALTFGMIMMPFRFGDIETVTVIGREIDTIWEALISSVFGLILLPFTLILLGKVALLWRNLNNNLLRVDESTQYKRKNISRSEIEQDILNRLVDQELRESNIEENEPYRQQFDSK